LLRTLDSPEHGVLVGREWGQISASLLPRVGPVQGVIPRRASDTTATLRREVHIQAELGKRDIHRSRLRILETCLWASHPRAPVKPAAGGWERVVRLKTPCHDSLPKAGPEPVNPLTSIRRR
jgi:hypothetical protein